MLFIDDKDSVFRTVSPAARYQRGPRSQEEMGKRGRLYLTLKPHCHHQMDLCIKVGSGLSHYNGIDHYL